jgi:hypothetical protein
MGDAVAGFVAALSLPFVLLLGVAACRERLDRTGDGDDGDGGREESAEFVGGAERADCARDVNRIYRIDDAWVLWHREELGCADAGYAITL